MDIKEMRYFVEVCKYKNISKAAQTLFITQQALSKSMKNLELSLDVILFKRNTNKIELTENGEYLFEKVLVELFHHETFIQEINNKFKIDKNTIKLGIVPGALRTVGANILIDFIEFNKQIKVEITDSFDKIGEQMLLTDDLDVLISTKPTNLTKFDFISLKKEPLFVISHKDFPLPCYEYITFLDLKDIPLAICNDNLNLHYLVTSGFENSNITPNIIFKANEIELMLDIVEQKKAINICAKHVTNGLDSRKIIAVPFEQDHFYWDIGIVLKKNQPLNPSISLMIDSIKNKV